MYFTNQIHFVVMYILAFTLKCAIFIHWKQFPISFVLGKQRYCRIYTVKTKLTQKLLKLLAYLKWFKVYFILSNAVGENFKTCISQMDQNRLHMHSKK